MSREERLKRAYRQIRQNQEPEKDLTSENPSGGFEPPTTAVIEEIFGEIRRLAKEHSILLPPPFLPESLPKIPASRRENDSVDRLERLPKIKETPKPEPEKHQIYFNCPRCHTPSPVGTRFCGVCGWNLDMQYTAERGYELRK
jgi:hypothetical protein